MERSDTNIIACAFAREIGQFYLDSENEKKFQEWLKNKESGKDKQ